MPRFTAIIKRFNDKGEKTGWTYIEVPADIANEMKPGHKKSFSVKGKLDAYDFDGLSLLPMGEGNFILALNATIRKSIRKQKGASVTVQMEPDDVPYQLNSDLIQCLADDPKATAVFARLPNSHKNYYSKWIDSAKTEQTKTKRIAWAVTALSKKQGYNEMIRSHKK